MTDVRMTIDGEPSDAADGSRFESVNPLTGEGWASVPDATSEDVDRAMTAAGEAFPTWRALPGHERGELMRALADAMEDEAEQLAELETRDNGKVIRETHSQVGFAARNLRFFAGYADKLYGRTIPLDKPSVHDHTVRRPYGVVAVITAWNSPIALLCNKLPPALAAGNTVVVKPSEHASVTTCEIGRLVREVGFPPGVVNIVTGAGDVGAEVTGHPTTDKISFTGSPATARRIAAQASERLVPLTLELGGKSANIVFEDANLDHAVVGAVAGIFAAAGQSCVAGSRLLVQDDVYDTVVDAVVERARNIRLGDPLDPDTEMGPIANRPQFDRILELIEAARREGATLRAGGGEAAPPTVGDEGLFVQPTVFTDVDPSMRIATEEVFGPVLSVLSFSDEEEALEIANDSPYGLAGGVWTQNLARAFRVSGGLETGVLWVNTYRASAAQAPHGGVKASGYGRERGGEALDEYTYVQNRMFDFSESVSDPFAIRT